MSQNSEFLNSTNQDNPSLKESEYKYKNSEITDGSDSWRGRDWRKENEALHFFHPRPLTFSSQHEETFNPSLSVWTGDETRRVSRTRTLDTDTGNEMEI